MFCSLYNSLNKWGYLEAYGDFKLIVNQVKGAYEVCHEDLIPYHHAAIKLLTHLTASTLTMYLTS